MATEGKHSPFTLKALVLSGVGVVATWALGKLLDYLFDLSLLKAVQSFFAGVWLWLSQDMPIPYWAVLAIFTVLLCAGGVASYFRRVAAIANSDLEKAEALLHSHLNPKSPRLSSLQHKIIMQMGSLADNGIDFKPNFLAKDCGLTALEFDVGFRQLISEGMVNWGPINLVSGAQSPALTLKGKEYILQARSDIKAMLS